MMVKRSNDFTANGVINQMVVGTKYKYTIQKYKMYYHKYICISELYQEKKISLVIPILFSPYAFGWSMVQQLRYLGDSQNSNGGIHHIV